MKDIDVEQLFNSFSDYEENYQTIQNMVDQGKIIPVKSSGLNGMFPPLYNRYRKKSSPKKDIHYLKDVMQQEICPPLSTVYYEKKLAQYEKDRPMILALQKWIFKNSPPPEPVSINERSFEIFQQEKILADHGLRLLNNLHLDESVLSIYDTCEPASCFSVPNSCGPILIVENRDPFVAIRKLLSEGQKTICGLPVSNVVYGRGKNICRSFQDLLEFGTPEIKSSLNQIYYWGDLDWEGFQIYESLCDRWPDYHFHLFVSGYLAMLDKALPIRELPVMKEGQKENLESTVLNSFDPANQKILYQILKFETRYDCPEKTLFRTYT